MSAAMMLASCGGTKDAGQNGTLIERSDIKIEGKRMTPEALWAMGRIGSVAVSPDEKQSAYSVAYYSVPENKSNNELFVMNADGSIRSLRFVFPPEQVAPYEDGAQSVEVPAKVLMPLVAPAYRPLFRAG